MIFNSIAFLIFFPIVFSIYWIIPSRLYKIQNALLLFSSYVFYGWWDWRFLSLIALSTIVDYIVGRQLYKIEKLGPRNRWILVSVLFNLGLLGFFKYFNFFIDSFVVAFNSIGIDVGYSTLKIILPVGISFYTFQTMSYSLDIYRKKLKPTNDFIAFATFVSLFPQLVAGPIERASNLIPQITKKRIWKHENFKSGLFQILIGFFRKVVVADTIGSYIDGTFATPEIQNSFTIIIAIVLYAFQIYYDFSGYSDIAIGTAKLLGFSFKQNFNFPYFSSSITEFWRRWHISLSSWLKDYLYIPLGGNRKGIVLQYRNLLLTMLIGGLWHGSSWNFVIWGGIHGIVLMAEKRLKLIHDGYSILRSFSVFIVVCISWIFFRSESFSDSIVILTKIFTGPYTKPYFGNLNVLFSLIFVLGLAIMFDFALFKKGFRLEQFGQRLSTVSFVLFSNFILIIIVLFISGSQNFIYFQF